MIAGLVVRLLYIRPNTLSIATVPTNAYNP